MKEQINTDKSKKIHRKPLESENDQAEFGGEEGEELNENESEIDTTVPDKTEVDLDQTGISNADEEQSGSAGPH